MLYSIIIPSLPNAAGRHRFPATCLRLCPAHFEFVDFSGLAQFRADVFITEAPKLVDESHLVRCRYNDITAHVVASLPEAVYPTALYLSSHRTYRSIFQLEMSIN